MVGLLFGIYVNDTVWNASCRILFPLTPVPLHRLGQHALKHSAGRQKNRTQVTVAVKLTFGCTVCLGATSKPVLCKSERGWLVTLLLNVMGATSPWQSSCLISPWICLSLYPVLLSACLCLLSPFPLVKTPSKSQLHALTELGGAAPSYSCSPGYSSLQSGHQHQLMAFLRSYFFRGVT